MHFTIKNLETIKEEVKLNVKNDHLPEIIAVSKTFAIEKIKPLIEYGHKHFGENKVQEAKNKWMDIKKKRSDISLHLIGKLQSNKVNQAIEIFDYIHSVDNKKLAKKIAEAEVKKNKKLKLFLQVNLASEEQKSGVSVEDLSDLVNFCYESKLDVQGLMCIPPLNENSEHYFQKLYQLNNQHNYKQLSMGMSSDYLNATKYSSTFLRIGSKIFGERI